jgi:hypothetical protein
MWLVHRCQEWEAKYPASLHRATSIDARTSPDYHDHRPSGNVSRSAVRNHDVNRDDPRTPSAIPTIDHRERLWDRA